MTIGEQKGIDIEEKYKMKKMKWIVSLSSNYNKYKWCAKSEDGAIIFYSKEIGNKDSAMEDWKLFASANRIKHWVFINKNS